MNRRAFLHAGVGLACTVAGCTDVTGPLSPSESDSLTCPSTVPRVEAGDFHGEFEMVCDTASETETDTGETTLSPNSRTMSLPEAQNTVTLTNHRDQQFNTQFYGWGLQKLVDGEWYGTVGRRIPADAKSSLAPGASHSWSLSVTNDDLHRPVDAVEGDQSLSLRALGGGDYAFVVFGSYGEQGQSWGANQPIVGYAAPFRLDGDSLALVPTDTVRDVSRDGDDVTVTTGTESASRSVTVSKQSPSTTPTDGQQRAYIVESVYGKPALRDVLAHFEEGVETVTLQTDRLVFPPFSPDTTFSYEENTYAVTDWT